MKAMVEFKFSVEDPLTSQMVCQVLNQLEVEHPEPSIKGFGRSFWYTAFVEYESQICKHLEDRLRQIGVPRIGHRYFFRFTDQEYESAPFYRLLSLGNDPDSNLTSDKSSYTLQWFDKECGIQYLEQIAPLSINTEKIRSRDAVHVDNNCIIVSKRLASLLSDWKISGYDLLPVMHKGPSRGQTVFQLKPTNTLPPWSSKMRYVYPPHLDRFPCDFQKRIDYPFHYDRTALDNAGDINETHEMLSARKLTKKATVISARLRRLLLNNMICFDARYADKPEGCHWQFDPIIVVE